MKQRKEQLYNAIIYRMNCEPICVSGIVAIDENAAGERALQIENINPDDVCALTIIDMVVGI